MSTINVEFRDLINSPLWWNSLKRSCISSLIIDQKVQINLRLKSSGPGDLSLCFLVQQQFHPQKNPVQVVLCGHCQECQSANYLALVWLEIPQCKVVGNILWQLLSTSHYRRSPLLQLHLFNIIISSFLISKIMKKSCSLVTFNPLLSWFLLPRDCFPLKFFGQLISQLVPFVTSELLSTERPSCCSNKLNSFIMPLIANSSLIPTSLVHCLIAFYSDLSL